MRCFVFHVIRVMSAWVMPSSSSNRVIPVISFVAMMYSVQRGQPCHIYGKKPLTLRLSYQSLAR
eukprot:m.200840 g.200840  ORF g.200840 m.200840 type:complete len:64 (-) comp32776_c0_seq2:403-594(-)